jgi:hypothetical protein
VLEECPEKGVGWLLFLKSRYFKKRIFPNLLTAKQSNRDWTTNPIEQADGPTISLKK